MTDRINSLTVILEKDTRADDIECLKNAILQLKGIIAVEKNVSDLGTFLAEKRAKYELRSKLWDVLK
jgi:hypothetical protein